MAKAKSALKRAAPKKRARKAAAGSRGLDPRHCLVEDADFEKETKERIEREGGQVHPLQRRRQPLVVFGQPAETRQPREGDRKSVV